MSQDDHAGVIARPPLLYGAGLAAGVLLEYLWPLGTGLFAPALVVLVIGAASFLCGGMVLASAIRRFGHAGTTVPTNTPTTALVTDGPYRYSRNPIYIALTMVYAGLALMLNAWWAFAALPVVLAIMERGVIRREEAYLEARFGETYRTYREKVSRWL